MRTKSALRTSEIRRNPQEVYGKLVMQIKEIASDINTSDDRADGLVQLIQAWIDEDDTDEQRETLAYLIHTLDKDRLSNRKLFSKKMKGKSS